MYLSSISLPYADIVIKECNMEFDLPFIYVAILVSRIKGRTVD